MAKISEIFEDFTLFQTEANKLRKKISELKDTLEKDKRRREDLMTLPLCRSDRIALLDAWVDQHVKNYPAALQPALDGAFGSPDIPNTPGNLVELFTVTAHVGFTGSLSHLQKALFFYFPDAFKAGFRRAIEAMPPNENEGPPMVDRRIEIEKLDKAIARTEERLSSLANAATDIGLNIS